MCWSVTAPVWPSRAGRDRAVPSPPSSPPAGSYKLTGVNPPIATISLQEPLLRGSRRPRVALVGRAGVGKSTIFQAAASVFVQHERLAGEGPAYQECIVEVGLDQISLVDLPSIQSFHQLDDSDRGVLKSLLWGDRWPIIARHDSQIGRAHA